MTVQFDSGVRRNWLPRAAQVLLGAALAVIVPQQAQAVFISMPSAPIAITMRVGTAAAGVVDTVTFPTVALSNISPLPAESALGGGVVIEVLAERSVLSGSRNIVVNVDSAAGMGCVSGGCGSTIIPLTEVCWSSDGGTGGDIPSNLCFSGSGSQQVAAFSSASGSSLLMRNILNFKYRNSRMYPAGSYRGTVTYTATML